MASILLVNDYVKQRYGVRLGLDRFVEDWLRISEVEAAKFETVAQRNVEKVAKISAQVNYVEQQEGHTKLVPFSRRRNNK
jgi:hypothetical protein